jgi:tryptophan-rich sensory protein
MKWYRKCDRVPWQPPDYVFGIVWPILYVLYALISYLQWNEIESRNILILGILMNLAWVPLFTVNVKIALILLTAMIVVGIKTIFVLNGSDRRNGNKGIMRRALLFSPYLLWLCFAWTLNAYLALNCDR